MTNSTTPLGTDSVRWSLDELYASPTDPAIERVLAKGLAFARDFEERRRGHLAELAGADLAAALAELGAHLEEQARPALYASLRHALDTRDPESGRLLARVEEASAERGRHLVFVTLELARLDDEQVAALRADAAAATYVHAIEQFRALRNHQLSDVEERLLVELGPVGAGAWARLYSELASAIRAPIGDEQLPLALALARQDDPDRSAREAAVHGVSAGLERDVRTRAYAFNMILQDKAIDDRLRSFPSWLRRRNLANEISDESVAALIQAVLDRQGLVHRYYRAKRKLLGVPRLELWDRQAPLGQSSGRRTWEDARRIVLDAYTAFSPRAGELVAQFFDEGWIDAPVREGKQHGAFCAASGPGLHPFVFLNYTGRVEDVLTLAHEVGHGLHDLLAARQHYFDFHPPLILAETASVFGETLTFESLLSEETDRDVRLSLICRQIEGAIGTVFRQASFNRFEDAAHRARREEGELSVARIGELWQASVQPMFGDALILPDEHATWWSYIDHFVHTPGYVYAYAYGQLLALTLVQRFRAAGSSFVDGYFDFLAAGGSLAPEALAGRLELNVADPAFWSEGLDVIEALVTEVETHAGA